MTLSTKKIAQYYQDACLAQRRGNPMPAPTLARIMLRDSLAPHLKRVLNAVENADGVTSNDVAQQLGITLVNASTCLGRLHELGLIIKEVDNTPYIQFVWHGVEEG